MLGAMFETDPAIGIGTVIGIASALIAALTTAVTVLWKKLQDCQEARIAQVASQADRHKADMDQLLSEIRKKKKE